MIMNIAVVAANGKVGNLVVKEAKERGMKVTSIVQTNKNNEENVIEKGVLDLTKEDLAGFDAIVDAVGALAPETVHIIPDAAKHLADLLKDTDTRLVVVGGASSLFVNPEHTQTVLDVSPDLPAEAMPLFKAHKEALDALREYTDVNWTSVSPAGEFNFDGERTGKYILGGEELTLNGNGESVVSYADFAIAMVDEIESGKHLKQRISVVSV